MTDSKLPYKFEDGMRVCHADGNLFIVTRVDVGDSGLWCVFGDANIYAPMRDCAADIDHPGTRGLLLAQYREASGHGIASTVCRDGWWCVDTDPGGGESNEVVGEGESEGAAILDALVLLAASKAAAACPNAGTNIERRVQLIEDALDNDRLARIEARLARIEAGHV